MEDFENFLLSIEVMLVCKGSLLFVAFLNEMNEIYTFQVLKISSEEISRTEYLLTHLMPLHVLDLLKEGTTVAEQLENVSIMFADIVGFTNFSNSRTPKQVIEVLKQLFGKFDRLCSHYNCYKVCTIGDCYLAISYNGASDQRDYIDELCKTIAFAKSLIRTIEETNKECESSLAMRIGVHIGKIIGGISGSTIVRYDIYGPDVMVANKMESEGKPGFVNVSENVKQILESQTKHKSFQFNKEFVIKSGRKQEAKDISLKCYFVNFEEDSEV